MAPLAESRAAWWRHLSGRDGRPAAGEAVRRRRGALLLALGSTLLVALLSLATPWRQAEARLFDFLSTIAPPPLLADGPVVVAIDEPSFAEIAQQWPWPRSLHARLVEALRAAGAKAIGLDIIFAEPSADPAADAALAAALGPDVVLAADETVIRTPQADQSVRTEPLPELLAGGARTGLASVVLDGDGILRRVPRYPDSFAAVLLETAGRKPVEPPPGALLQTFGPGRTYPTVSYYQALAPENFLPPGFFHDRTVIVGLSLQSAADARSGGADAFATSQTPRTGRLVAGTEVQANLFDNLAGGLFVSPAPPALHVALIAAAALLAALAVRRGTGWRTLIWSALAAACFVAGSFFLLRFGRLYVAPPGPALAFLLVAGAQGARDYAAERRLRRGITRAFSQYVSPVIVERLAADPSLLKLGGERRTLTILFCDVRGFTTISERMKSDPEGLTRLVNRLLDPLSAAVIRHGGTIDKYIGDAVMAFWNAPLDDPDHALHAAQAALAMHEAMAELNRQLAAEAGVRPPLSLQIGVGINTGDCVVGNMGSSMRFDYSVLGDAVNLASRLEGETKRYGVGILLGEETARLIGDRLPLAPLDRVLVKGKSEPATVSAIAAGASPDMLAAHRMLAADFWAGRLPADDARLALLALQIPSLAPFYAGLQERIAGGIANSAAGLS